MRHGRDPSATRKIRADSNFRAASPEFGTASTDQPTPSERCAESLKSTVTRSDDRSVTPARSLTAASSNTGDARAARPGCRT
ncbi:hypothetical protein NSK11_contig00090-0017 [Nocardia seriolae]|uniref:Uncharacterized protein n=1 Tax=Nocardia seriolae TaxID=37332 RepID=A0ABC9YYX9_9NOCA|nr:hypothetical protein NS07_v2contig00084-0018 [Nocardia seriolae]GAP30652.1 hypothetical protein NSK11_contig00090-0017 [Nocardia seriolae]